MKSVLLIFCIFFAGVKAIAQPPYIYFNRITTQAGLSHNKVNCILQDKRGFMWIGTEDGLNRYDGHFFVTFRNRPGDTASLSGNIITDLLEDEHGVLWIATADGGLTKYDYRLPPSLQFRQYKHIPGDANSIPVNTINALLEDSFGYLWLATNGKSVLRFNKKSERFEQPVLEGTKNALGLCLDEKGILWVGRQGGGFLKVDTKNLSYQMDARYTNLYATLPHATVSSLYRDTENIIWFGSWDNILYKATSAGREEKLQQTSRPYSFPNDEILAFAEDAQGRLWMGGHYFGLTLYDKKTGCFYNYRYDAARDGTVAGNHINCIYRDHSGMMWLGTERGISVFNPAQQSFVQTFLPLEKKDITIYDFYEDDQKDLWIGTSNGLFVQKAGTQTIEHKLLFYNGKALAVTKFFKDNNTLYLGTNFSLFTYDASKNKLALLPNTKQDKVMYDIIDSRVVSIIKDTINGHPVLLVSPYGHFLSYYDFTEKRWISRTDTAKKIIDAFHLKDNLIRKFYKSGSGQIWLVTGKAGLGEWKRTAVPTVSYLSTNPLQKGALTSDAVFDVYEDEKKNLWVSTYGGGLHYFDVGLKKFWHIEVSDNLLEGIETDSRGVVWMIGNGNLHQYDPRTNSYTTHQLPDLEKSGGVHGAIYKARDGSMYVSGTNYFIHFQPESIQNTIRLPKVYLTDFRIFNTSYSHLLFQKSIALRYNQNYFTLQFAAPEFSNGNIVYQYKLDGVDRDWINAGDRNFVSYANLQSGTYTFNVRATYQKGLWPSIYTSLQIAIVPPLWRRWWFYVICAIFVTGAAYALYRYRINELLKRQAIRNKIAQDLHDNLGSTLSSISVYSQVAKIYNQQQKWDALQQTLEKISTASSEMIAEMSDIVWALNPRNDTMNTMLQRMESYARPLLQAKGIDFRFEYDPALTEISLQMEQRKNFYLIFKEAVTNCLKYAACTHLQVQIQIQQKSIALWVKDDGNGFDMDGIPKGASASLSGNGLQNMQRRAQEMSGECTIQSKPGHGTIVHLTFAIP